MRQSVEVTQAEDIRRESDLMMLNLKDSMNENNRKEIQNGTGKIEINEQQAAIVRQIFKWPRHVAMLR